MTHEARIAELVGREKLGAEICLDRRHLVSLQPAAIAVGLPAVQGNFDVTAHPASLPFRDNSLDFVAAIQVLNRIANPVAALAEWYRVLRPTGIIYLAVDHRLATADQTRDLTSIDHLLEDYVRQTTECDASHIDAFVYDTDWSMEHPDTPRDEIPGERAALARRLHEAVGRGEPVDIRFHTFEPSSLRELVETLCCWPRRRLNWQLAHEAVDPTDGTATFCTTIRVQKNWLDRAQAGALDVVAKTDRRAAIMLTGRPSAAESAVGNR